MTSIFNLSQISITFIKNLQKIYSIFLYKKLKSFFAKVQRIMRVYTRLKIETIFCKKIKTPYARIYTRLKIEVIFCKKIKATYTSKSLFATLKKLKYFVVYICYRHPNQQTLQANQ